MVWPRCTVTRQAFHISSEFTVLTLYRTIVVAGIAVCVDAKSITVGAGSGEMKIVPFRRIPITSEF